MSVFAPKFLVMISYSIGCYNLQARVYESEKLDRPVVLQDPTNEYLRSKPRKEYITPPQIYYQRTCESHLRTDDHAKVAISLKPISPAILRWQISL